MLGWAVTRHSMINRRAAATEVKAAKPPDINYDHRLIEKMNDLTAQFDYNKPECTYAGMINMTDGRDSTHTVKGIRFLFCRKNKSFYYQVGNTETIHRDGLNIFIEHEQQKVVVSARNFDIKSPVHNTEGMEKMLRYENYALISRTDSATKTISVVNEHHISCKEISASYDTVSGNLKRIYTRLSDVTDPLNKKKERQVEVLFSRISGTGNLRLYPAVADVLEKEKGGWKLTTKYAKYELIRL